VLPLLIAFVLVIMLIAWVVLFAIWYRLNIPLGPGYLPRT